MERNNSFRRRAPAKSSIAEGGAAVTNRLAVYGECAS